MGQEVQLDASGPLQFWHDRAHEAHRPVLLSPYMLVPQLVTQDKPRRKLPGLQEVHCEGLFTQVLQALEQLLQKVLTEPRQTPARYWLGPHEAAVVQKRQVGVL